MNYDRRAGGSPPGMGKAAVSEVLESLQEALRLEKEAAQAVKSIDRAMSFVLMAIRDTQ